MELGVPPSLSSLCRHELLSSPHIRWCSRRHETYDGVSVDSRPAAMGSPARPP
uniref:Uncharacterized protein n=1 Tax=Arundo donax TaxID=35708 RepID=A0A0A8XRU8_ARUDO